MPVSVPEVNRARHREVRSKMTKGVSTMMTKDTSHPQTAMSTVQDQESCDEFVDHCNCRLVAELDLVTVRQFRLSKSWFTAMPLGQRALHDLVQTPR